MLVKHAFAMTTYYDKTNHSPARGGRKMHLCFRELVRNNTMLVYLSFLSVRQEGDASVL
jgi:hypothetical protein